VLLFAQPLKREEKKNENTWFSEEIETILTFENVYALW